MAFVICNLWRILNSTLFQISQKNIYFIISDALFQTHQETEYQPQENRISHP
jgi:hypothetical protein